MTDKPTQKFLPFDEVTVEATSPLLEGSRTPYEPSDEARASFERLEGWLLDVRGRPIDDAAEETLRFLARALLEGKRGYHHAAEDRLEGMLVCPRDPETKEFRQAVEGCLDQLHEIMLSPERER